MNSAATGEMIGANDVLLCEQRRGAVKHAHHHHPGNLRYKNLVRRYQDSYASAKKKQEKQMICQRIVDTIRYDHGGRFLKFDSKANLWLDVGTKKACEKTSQTLLRDQSSSSPSPTLFTCTAAASGSLTGGGGKSNLKLLIRGPRIRIFKERMMLDEATAMTEASSMCSSSSSTASSPSIIMSSSAAAVMAMDEASSSSSHHGTLVAGYDAVAGHHHHTPHQHALAGTVYVRSN